MHFPLLCGVILLAGILQIAFACLAVNNGDSEPTTPGPFAACSVCPTLYAPNCNGLKDRKQCLTSTQAQVHRYLIIGRCMFNYTCPEPTHAYAWPVKGNGPIAVSGELECNGPDYTWRIRKYGVTEKIACMSRPQTRCGGCVDVYKPRDPCTVSTCAPRKEVSLSVTRDPNNKKRCLMNFSCPAGTEAYIYEAVAKGYVKATGETLTCTDKGPGSTWEAMLAPPFEVAFVDHMSSKPTFTIETLKPSNAELRSVIEDALKTNFKNVEDVCKECHAPSSFVFGPGAGPWPVVGRNCEMVADANFASSKVATKIASLVEGHSTPYKMSIIDSPKFSLMANLAVSGEPGPAEVVHCKCSVRVGKDNFPETIRKGLAKHYGKMCVSLGGVFLMREGEAKLHVMPDFPGCPFKAREEVDKWLRFFTMKAPLVCASVFHSYDPGHKLRLEHTHCYSEHGDAGHYHYDTTPETVVYEGWFTAAEKIYRIDEI
ncbi:hypothetical protein ANCCEY_08910 [Ancylostoma ceylanicum]|uniref:DUF1907 domain-containing protein n=1 Tax=Ancylostoma ceylanicum TaxID=53326 RepID=A0A0D6LPN9_9BILA|nr:hypothetical protein ANCCEY_08910 [Ancylostoma ceylanicum]